MSIFSSQSICEDLPRRPDLKFRTLFETFRFAEREATEAIPDGILEGAVEIAVFSPHKGFDGLGEYRCVLEQEAVTAAA